MRLEEQVTSLEISKRLKELGVPQKSIFYWYHYKNVDGRYEIHMSMDGGIDLSEDVELGLAYSAFTVAELGLLLPSSLTCDKWDNWENTLHTYKHEDGWVYSYEAGDAFATTVKVKEISEADARGKMLIYLVENGLLTLTKDI